MKVHVYTPSFFPRLVGMTYAAHARAEMLRELGADVTVVAPATAGAADAVDPGYPVRRFDVRGTGMPWSPVRGDIRGLREFAARERPDVVISEGWYTWGAWLLPWVRAAGPHAVLASHGAADKAVGRATPAAVGRALAYRAFERFGLHGILRSLSAAIVLSTIEDDDRFSDNVQFRRAGVPLYVCPNVSAYAPAPAPAPRALPPVRTLLHVGEMLPHKNQLLGVEVLRALPSEYRFAFAFPVRTPYFDRLRAAVELAGLSGRVEYVEGRNRVQLEEVFDRASCLIILSQTEAQPIVAVDALRKALPFVSTPVGCMREMEGGLVARPAGLASSVLRVHASAEAYFGFSAAAAAFYARRYERAISVRALGDLLGQLSE